MVWNIPNGGGKEKRCYICRGREIVHSPDQLSGWNDGKHLGGCGATACANQRGRWFMLMKESCHYADAGAAPATLIGRGGHYSVCVQHPPPHRNQSFASTSLLRFFSFSFSLFLPLSPSLLLKKSELTLLNLKETLPNVLIDITSLTATMLNLNIRSWLR